LKKCILLLVFLFLNTLFAFSQSDKVDPDSLFKGFSKYYYSGDLVNAERILLLLLNSPSQVSKEYLIFGYVNLCSTYMLQGRYQEALEYNNRGEKLLLSNSQESKELAAIYGNKGLIYSIKKTYDFAIDYLEKSIRIYNKLYLLDNSIAFNYSSAFLNLGIVFLETGNLKSAMDNFIKSLNLKLKYNLKGIPLVYLNIAKTYVKTGDTLKAEEFYLKSISTFIKESGTGYYRLVDVYFDYALFLRTSGRTTESLEALNKALTICLKNYGEKHTYVSLSYKLIGDHYKNLSDYPTALSYYQKSLIAVVKDFNDPDIFSNPAVDSSLFDIRLLDDLKSKSKALELLALQQTDNAAKICTMYKSLETIELALKLIDMIRNDYLSEESRIYLAENEKETYIFATHIAGSVFNLSHADSMVYTIYSIAQRAKAAVLRHEIAGNDLLYSAGMPDSLREKQTRLSGNISYYNKMLLDETRKTNPDSSKVTLLKDALFGLNREKENVAAQLGYAFPQYYELIRKVDPVKIAVIQEHLKEGETIIDYLLSNSISEGKKKLYIFLISSDNLIFRETDLDSLFRRNALILRNTTSPVRSESDPKISFANYTGALNYMYLNLVKPVEGLFRGNKLIVIPDEEIGWLPFDAFLKSNPEPGQSDYEGLDYLINDYTFSYGYSSSLIFSSDTGIKRGAEVISFSPSYGNQTASGQTPNTLGGAESEIESIYRWFKGKMYNGDQATKLNFVEALLSPAIFHLAMHSMSDSINSRYSYMLFDTRNGQTESGRLYNYEISLSRLRSPMVVLSACNSGTGTLYSGEGLMSLARGFILAGASSVIKTAWEVNDDASSKIITSFYRYLSKGKRKNEALRLAKLEYLKSSSPAFTNPYYWAAYEVLGDNAKVTNNYLVMISTVSGLIVILAGGLFLYFRRRRIFSDRSR
jgi:CHAT domain-containing protein/tetratricopeptide (TPR) repeat protein